MRRLIVGVLLAQSCSCPTPEQLVTNEGMHGYWRPRDREQLVFAFAPASEAEELFNLSGNTVEPQTKPVGAVYERDSLVQLTTFEATQTELKQTVLVDVGSPPGTQFSTRIDGFERGVSMQLESKKNDGGTRAWDFYDFCPRSRDYGWGEVAVTACPTATANGGSAAFDKQGRLYVYTGSGLAPGTACPPGPGFLEIQRGCGFAQFDAPNGRLSASRVHDDDVLRIAYVHLDSSLRVRERPIGERDFVETTLLPTSRTTSLHLLEQQGPLLITGMLAPSGDPQVFRRVGGAWVEGTLKRKSTGQPMTPVPHAVVDGSARLWIAAGTELWVEGESAFELLPSAAPGTIGSLYLDPEGAPHVLAQTPRGLEYAVLRAGGWERHVVDASTSGVIVTHGTRPYRLLTTASALRNPSGEVTPWLHPALITIHEDGRLESELSGGPYNLLAGNTTFAAVGPRGEVAASLTGETIMTRSPKGRLYAAPKKLEIQINGPPMRVFTADGRFSCEQSCTVDATLGERLAFRVEKKPGVLATLPSCDRNRPASAPCWFSVVPPQNPSTLEMNAVFRVLTRATPLLDAFPASNSQGLATTLGVTGDWVAVGTLFAAAATTFQLDDVAIPVTGSFQSGGLAMVNRVSKQSLFVALSGPSVERVLPDGNGGLWAVLSTTSAVQVGGVTIGASQTNGLSFLHVTPAGTVDTAVALSSTPRNMPIGVVGLSIGADGSAAAVFSGNGPLTALGITESNALVRVAPDGTRTVHGFAGPTSSGGKVFAIDVDHIVFAANTAAASTLFSWSGGQLQSLALPGATVRAIHATSNGAVVAMSSAADLSIAGRQLAGLRHVLSVDPSLAITGTFSLPTATTATWSWGVGIVPEGVGFMSGGELQWLSPTLTPLRSVLPLPSTTMQVSGVQPLPTSVSGGSVWILARPDADFGVVGSMAVAQLGFLAP